MRTYVIVTRYFPSAEEWRGAYCLDFAKALTQQLAHARHDGPWKVCVFVPGAKDYEIEGIQVRGFRELRLPSNVFPFLFSRRNRRSFLDAVARAGIDVGEVSVCHGHTADCAIYPLALKAKNPNCRTLLHHHDLCSFGLNLGILHTCWLYNLIQFPILRRVHEQIDCHVFISSASRRSFLAAPDTSWTTYADYKRQMRGLPYRPVRIKDSVILHNGVDMRMFGAQGPKPESEGARREFVIGCVANFQPLKDQMTLLKAVKLIRDGAVGSSLGEDAKLKVRFVGGGETLAVCKRYAAENGIDSEFLSEVRHEELPAFYRTLDLFVMPSYFEGFGCVYTEAHACGAPFMACEGQGIEDVLPQDERSRWLCKPGDPASLAQKIRDYLENRWEQKLLSDQSIEALVAEFVRTSLG